MQVIETETNLYRKVSKKPLSALLKNKPPKGQSHAIIDEQSKDILAFCSEDYHLRPNEILYTKFEEELNKLSLPFKKKILIFDGTKFYVNYIILQKIKSPIIKDLLPVFSIWNSYDGKIKTQICFGYHKLLCGNFISRPQDCLLSKSTKHCFLSDTELNNVTKEFITKAQEFLTQTDKDILKFEKLSQKPATERLLNKTLSKLSSSEKYCEVALERLKIETTRQSYINEHGNKVFSPGQELSYFSVYNALNYAIFNTNHKELFDVKVKKDKNLLCHFIS